MGTQLQTHYERFLATFREMTYEDGSPLFKAVHEPLQRLCEPFPLVEVYYTDHFQAQIIVGEMTGANNADVDALALTLADRLLFYYGWRFALGYIMHEGHLYRCMSHHFWQWRASNGLSSAAHYPTDQRGDIHARSRRCPAATDTAVLYAVRH